MRNKLSVYSTESIVNLNVNIENVWNLLSRPSHLELVHPFCKSHRVIIWNDKTKIDQITYLNGLVYQRNIFSWEKNKGFKLTIGKKEGKKSKVEWELLSIKDMTQLKIKVTPYISERFSPIVYNFLLSIYILPQLKKYLKNVTRGVKYYLDGGKPIIPNQFGKHNWFS